MTTTDERSDIEKLREWLGLGEGCLPLCTSHYGPKQSCTCGLTEARELAKRVEEQISETGSYWVNIREENRELQAKFSTAEAELAKPRCEHGCGQIVDHTLVCGAPQCCEACCKLQKADAERDAAREKMKLLRDVAAELWGPRDLWDESPTRFLAWVHNQTGGEAVRGMKAEAERDTLRARVEERDTRIHKLEMQLPQPHGVKDNKPLHEACTMCTGNTKE